MRESFDEALAILQIRRAALLRTAEEARERLAPSRLVDDAAALLDPQFSFLTRLRQGVARNKLLSLAVVAGAAWLAGSSRQPDGKPPGARKVRRAKPKEKNNDSGQQQRDDRPEPGTGRRAKGPRAQGRDENFAQAEWRGARQRGEARVNGHIAPVGGAAQQRPLGAADRRTQQEPLEPVRRGGPQHQPLAGKLSA